MSARRPPGQSRGARRPLGWCPAHAATTARSARTSTGTSPTWRSTSTPPASAGRGRVSALTLHDVVDAPGQSLDVVRLDGREHRDPQLVAAELAVGLGVDDPIAAQHLCDRERIDGLVEVDGADDLRPR